MATIKLDCGTEYEVKESFNVRNGEMLIDELPINLHKPVVKTCKCLGFCKK